MAKKKGFLGLFKTKAEQKAYAIGRKHQYNKEHPLVRYEAVNLVTLYNKDGSICDRRYQDASHYVSKRAADKLTKLKNSSPIIAHQNKNVMRAVKAKNVDTSWSEGCMTEVWITRKLKKPYRK